MSLYFQPLQPFGMAAGGGLTAVRGSRVNILFNANTGQHFIESKPPLMPVEVVIRVLPTSPRESRFSMAYSHPY